jgi:phosphatidylserine/phosphatidylglycerophosphate/cardiolipin synthase-like enzyme
VRLLLVALAAALEVATGVLPARAYTPVQQTQFNVPARSPGTSPAKQLIFLTTVIEAADATPAGESITISMYSFYSEPVLRALLRAHRRGVAIKYLTHQKGATTGQARRLAAALGTDVRQRSWFKACAGSCARTGLTGEQHSKLVLFSRVRDSSGADVRYLSFVTSGNLGEFAGTGQLNSFESIVDQTIYLGAKAYVESLTADKDSDDYPTVTSGRYELSFFPRRRTTNDIVLRALQDTSAQGCRIRVAMYIWSGNKITTAERLAALKRGGCDIAVILVAAKTSNKVEAVLRRAGIPMYDSGIRGQYMHAKVTTIQGKIHGTQRSYVFTGSTNFTWSATHLNADLVLRIESAWEVQVHSRWFDSLVEGSTRKL